MNLYCRMYSDIICLASTNMLLVTEDGMLWAVCYPLNMLCSEDEEIIKIGLMIYVEQ